MTSDRPRHEVRYDERGDLDEVVALRPRRVHLERLDGAVWWLGIVMPDGTHVDVTTGPTPATVHVWNEEGRP